MQERAKLLTMSTSQDEAEQPASASNEDASQKQSHLSMDPQAENGKQPTSSSEVEQNLNSSPSQKILESASDESPLEASKAVEVASLALDKAESNDSNNPDSVVKTSKTKSVHPRRKEKLLLEARADRIAWVERVSLPYRTAESARSDDPSDSKSFKFRSSHAARETPSALSLLELLYNDDEGDSYGAQNEPSKMARRVDSLISSGMDNASSLAGVDSALPTGEQVITAELQDHQKDPILLAFHIFWLKLHDPQCASLVQGMRNFARNFCNLTEKDSMAVNLRGYIASTMSLIQSHTMWKDELEQSEDAIGDVRRSIESYMYGHCYQHIESCLWSSKEKAKDSEWLERLSKLQFVTPEHLEVSCLADPDHPCDDLLQKPMGALLRVAQYLSPFEKLQQILNVYREVNAALSQALNRNLSSQKLPSADDVLPTMILVLLRARPPRFLWDLQLIEDFSPPEYLRGEAGYAYTNLYGAVHFLQELDLSKDEPPSGLNIDKESFRKGLQACRSETEKRLEMQSQKEEEERSANGAPLPTYIPPQDISAARQRGERISIEWAKQWQQNQQATPQASSRAHNDNVKSAFDEAAEGLPEGFSRNYTFLHATPDDIKMSDLAQLLSEYKMLVQATESLIGDRAAKILASRRKEAAQKEHDLFERVRDVDPSLLPPLNGSKPR